MVCELIVLPLLIRIACFFTSSNWLIGFLSISGFYFTGEGALRDKAEDYRITGRMDDVINVSGKRLRTAEIEDAMVTSQEFFLT